MTTRSVLLGIAVAGLTGVVGAQSGTQTTTTHKTTTTAKKPVAASPTKVTGDGTKTASGLQYWDIKAGSGPPRLQGHCQMHYTGWLTDGDKFDSSYDTSAAALLARQGQRHQGLGRRRRRHEGRRQAPTPHSAEPGLRLARLSGRDPAGINFDFRRAVGGCEVRRSSTQTGTFEAGLSLRMN